MKLNEEVWARCYREGLSHFPTCRIEFLWKSRKLELIERIDLDLEPYAIYVCVDRKHKQVFAFPYDQAIDMEVTYLRTLDLLDCPVV